jgi:hypothetical protein
VKETGKLGEAIFEPFPMGLAVSRPLLSSTIDTSAELHSGIHAVTSPLDQHHHHVRRSCRCPLCPSGSSSIPTRRYALLRRGRRKAFLSSDQASYRSLWRRRYIRQRSGMISEVMRPDFPRVGTNQVPYSTLPQPRTPRSTTFQRHWRA